LFHQVLWAFKSIQNIEQEETIVEQQQQQQQQ
jgi:hypothetical protein